MTASVFLSHNRADKPFARKIAADLQRAGGSVWLDEEQIELGDSIQEAIQDAIDSNDYLAIILSPASVESKWVRQELRQALEREINTDRVVILPLLLRDCDIPGFLRDKLYADFRDPTEYDRALNLLKRKLGLTLTQPLEQSERTIQIIMHNLSSILVVVDAELDHLVSRHPDISRELKRIFALTGNARRTLRQHAVLQAFSQGTYRLRLDRRIPLVAIIKRLLSDHSQLVDPSRNVRWHTSGEQRVPPQSVDADLIEIAFFNVIENAFKYSMPNTTIEILFDTQRDSTIIRFANTGLVVGDVDTDIFERGFRGRNAYRTAVDGQGMGLYTARLIVAAHGGEIRYECMRDSSLNVFTVILPNDVRAA